MTSRVQFREDEDVVAFVQAQGVNPNELARRLFEDEVRRMRANHRHDRLRSAGVRLGGRSVADIVREDRDTR